MKTSSMQSKRRDLHHTWLRRETNEKYFIIDVNLLNWPIFYGYHILRKMVKIFRLQFLSFYR